MRVLISGGGTGGHVFPSLAIAGEITKRNLSNEVLFIGTRGGLESRMVPEQGYAFRPVSGGAVVRRGVSGAFSGAFFTAVGIAQSLSILKKFAPHVAVGMGGYASFPALAAARVLGIPVVICEQNSVPGLANRMLGKIARRVFLSFPPPDRSRLRFAAEKIRVVGNPARPELCAAARRAANTQAGGGDFTIFVLGGSQGANALNRFVPDAVAAFKEGAAKKVKVFHQTGKGAADKVERVYAAAGIEAVVFDFNPMVADFYAQASMVISRAGAGAVSEIALFSKPSILIPYPFAAGGHQRSNAEMMEKAGAAVVIEEKNLSQKTVAETLKRLVNSNSLEEMSRATAEFASPEAALRVVDEIEVLAGG
ncbi:MAG: undecaprenyldiphospho-muramoylpentapeptide beta-N-acetylglucosaminyltransferase [Candidatus Mycalebacterium zealandia]|nr:MAG: undecaprenyldiphospho-muramoylpentapeptide beta-N-acetylglucosaminyltransferase [Candidatus Mycalebacterium zealandia]